MAVGTARTIARSRLERTAPPVPSEVLVRSAGLGMRWSGHVGSVPRRAECVLGAPRRSCRSGNRLAFAPEVVRPVECEVERAIRPVGGTGQELGMRRRAWRSPRTWC